MDDWTLSSAFDLDCMLSTDPGHWLCILVLVIKSSGYGEAARQCIGIFRLDPVDMIHWWITSVLTTTTPCLGPPTRIGSSLFTTWTPDFSPHPFQFHFIFLFFYYFNSFILFYFNSILFYFHIFDFIFNSWFYFYYLNQLFLFPYFLFSFTLQLISFY